MVLLFVAAPVLIYLVIMLFSMRRMDEPLIFEEEKPNELYKLYPQGPPRYTLDYRGRLWIDKRQKDKGLFRTVRRPNLPPDEP